MKAGRLVTKTRIKRLTIYGFKDYDVVAGRELQPLQGQSTHWIFCSYLTKSLNESCGMGPSPFLTRSKHLDFTTNEILLEFCNYMSFCAFIQTFQRGLKTTSGDETTDKKIPQNFGRSFAGFAGFNRGVNLASIL